MAQLGLNQLTVASFDTTDASVALPAGFYSSCVPGECHTVEYEGCTGLFTDTQTDPLTY